MSDLVERLMFPVLREQREEEPNEVVVIKTADAEEAAAEITRLREEVERLHEDASVTTSQNDLIRRLAAERDEARSLLGEVRDRLDVIATADVYGNDKEGLQDLVVDIRCSARSLLSRIDSTNLTDEAKT